MMIDEQWLEEAYSACHRISAFDPKQVIQLMKTERVAISDMDDWCNQCRLDYPCLFQGNVHEGIL